MQRGLVTGIILGAFMVIFALQNTMTVPIKFLWLKFPEVSLALLIMISVVISVSIAATFAFIDKLSLKNKIKRQQAKLKELEDQYIEHEPIMTHNNGPINQEITIEGETGNKFFDY
jgi:lipopolysaccharide assembly protein A